LKPGGGFSSSLAARSFRAFVALSLLLKSFLFQNLARHGVHDRLALLLEVFINLLLLHLVLFYTLTFFKVFLVLQKSREVSEFAIFGLINNDLLLNYLLFSWLKFACVDLNASRICILFSGFGCHDWSEGATLKFFGLFVS